MSKSSRVSLLQIGTIVVLALLAAIPAHAGMSRDRLSIDESPPPTRRLLIKLRPQAQVAPGHVLSGYGIEQWTSLQVPGWIRATVPDTRLAHISAELAHDQNVLAIEEDHHVQVTLTPNDTYWAQQWGPGKTRVSAAWDVTTGREGIVIAVLDTGIDLDHSDLRGQVWVNPGEVPGNGIDDDGNGKVDDIHGWRFGQDQDHNIDDDHGHGTHVSGIIAARGNNQTGIAGMAWGCRIMVVKVLDYKGNGHYSDVANGLMYATDNGARIANLSLGGVEPSQVIKDAVDYARAHGTLVVAAAGNTHSAVLYPAAYEGALAIAASDQNDHRAPYSCYGPEVDLAAPGSSIYSTCVGDSYCSKSGTSMAAPHVSGLAALIWSAYPDHTAAQVTQRLLETAQDIESPGWDEYTGWGRIDAQNALSAMPAPWTLYLPISTYNSTLP